MSGISRGSGRGEILRRLLQERGLSTQDEPPKEETQELGGAPSAIQGHRPIGFGRGLLLSRVASKLGPGTSSQPPSAPLLPVPSASVAPPSPAFPLPSSDSSSGKMAMSSGLGRAKLLRLGSAKHTEPQELLAPPVPREAKTTAELSRGAARVAAHYQNVESACSADEMSKLVIAEIEDYLKPPVVMQGTSGAPLNVACNYVRLHTQPGKGIFQYDVKFKPDVDSRNTRFHVLKQLSDIIGDTKSFDGAILYLPTQLPDKVTYATATMPSDKSVVKVKITFVKSIQMGHPHAIQMYNVLFRRIMSILGLALHGRHFFDPRGAKPIPEFKLEVWPGFVTSIQNFEGGVMLCCDASYRVLRTQTVYELMTDLACSSKGPDTWKEDFVNLVVGVRVMTRYNNKIYRVDDVDFSASPKNTFMKSGSEISYIDYYKTHYNVHITDPGQPLLKCNVKTKIRGEETTQMIDLIPELCNLTGISESMRSNFKLMKSIGQFTRIPPAQRQLALNRFINNINSNQEVAELMGRWGISLAATNEVIPARMIAAEDVYFGRGNYHVGNTNCDWGPMATRNPVLSAVALGKWIIICTKRDEGVCHDFVKMCQQVGPKMGIDVSRPRVITLQNDNTQSYLHQLQQLRNDMAIIIVVLLPLQRADKYAAVKKYCCVDMPIPSQVIITRTIKNPDKLRSITQKIVLQMNCKLGGTLWTLKIPLKNTMIVGVDTYHDAKLRSSSVGAIVASLDAAMTRWYSRIYSQGQGKELIDGLVVSFLTCLGKYKEENGTFPDQIVIYRDGLGDGQLPTCKEYEIPQLMSALLQSHPGYEPKLLFVVCQKRISTRLFAKADSNFFNPPPGTVMDHCITRRDLFDFFLVSQNVRQGTVSPTHYIVIHNTTQLDPDKIQRLTYKMTHLYYNWCGTVRVPAPCQYAHKLASLVGDSIHQEGAETLADKLYYL